MADTGREIYARWFRRLLFNRRTPDKVFTREGILVKVIVHEAEEGGYWAEIPAFPGAYTQGETIEEIQRNVRDVIQLYLTLDRQDPVGEGRVLEMAV